MLKSSSSKSKKPRAGHANQNGRTRFAPRGRARTAFATSSKESNGSTKPTKSTLDNKALDASLQKAIDQKNERDLAGAVKTLATVIAARPDSVRALFLMGGFLLGLLNQPRKALPFFQRAIKLAPRWERVSLGLFHALWDLGREKAAMREIKRFQAVAHCADYDEITAELKAKGLWE